MARIHISMVGMCYHKCIINKLKFVNDIQECNERLYVIYKFRITSVPQYKQVV